MNRDGFFRLDQGHGIVLVLLSSQHVIARTDEMSGEQGDSEQTKFTPAMSIVLIFLVSVFFLIAFISLYIRQCTRGRFPLADGTASFRRSTSVPSGGLDPAVVNTFPTFLYSEVNRHKIGQGTLECAVCLIEFQDQDEEILRLLPKCSHVFHLNCIDAWLAIHVTCPVCRANLAPQQPGELGHLITLFHDSDYMTESYSPPRNGNSAQPDADLIIDLDPEEVIDIPRPSPNHKRPPTSTPTRLKLTGKFFRSHSTGHSVVQPGQNCERFTLRLPEEVRSQLVNSFGLKQSPQSGVVFPGESSSRRGYRSSSVGNNQGKACDNYDRAGRSAGWNFTRTPPFISRAGSSRSLSGSGRDDLMATQKTLMRSIKSPLDRLFRGTDKDDGQERSTRWLIPEPDGHS